MKNNLLVCLALVQALFNVAAVAHPGHNDVASVHGDNVGVWLMHQLYNVDSVMTFVVLGVLVALTRGRLFRRRRSRRQLIS